jgi:orotate phosphoribosyltransferase
MATAYEYGHDPRAATIGDLSHEELLELVNLIRTDGVVHSRGETVVVDRLGVRRPWGLYTPAVTLTSRGVSLAARALLAKVTTFRSTQIAGSGFTSIPLLSACVLLGHGRYTGLIIRDRPKSYLTRRRIDGPWDLSDPVVVLDDSVSSGTSLFQAIQALETEGFEVEGAVTLVNFSYQGGAERAYRRGYRVESVLDAWSDLSLPAQERQKLQPLVEATSAGTLIEPGLNPAVAARRVAEIYLTSGVPPLPPARFDREYDCRGGVWVSFRDRASETRLARDGFWHFDAGRADLYRDLVTATVKTIEHSAGAVSLRRLDGLKIAVTFFGPLERVAPAKLDFARYGIVVRDLSTRRKVGGALPNTQVFVSEAAQYHHATKRNARLASGEPHELFRHEVVKVVEPRESWLPYGVPDTALLAWTLDISVGKALVDRARHLLQGLDSAGALVPDALVPYPLSGAAVSIYPPAGGPTAGVSLAASPGGRPLDELLRGAARKALQPACAVPGATQPDVSCPQKLPAAGNDGSTIVVTLIYDPERHAALRVVTAKIRRGRDCVVASAGDNRLVALPTAIPYSNITRQQLVDSMAARVAGGAGPSSWETFRTTAWFGRGDDVRRMDFGFPLLEPQSLDALEMVGLLAHHIVSSLDQHGLPRYHLDPVRGSEVRGGTSARVVSGLVSLNAAGRLFSRSDWVAAAEPGLERCLDRVCVGGTEGALTLPGQRNGIMADCVLLAGILAAGEPLASHPGIPSLVARVARLMRRDGRISLHPVRLTRRQDHDFLPGAALLAIAGAVYAGMSSLDSDTVHRCLCWHQGRFRMLRSWGMAGWQPQAWAAIWRLTGDDRQAAFVFEVADWVLDHQLETSGAFVEDLAYNEPNFNTAFIAEAVAAAWSVATETGDKDRQGRYQHSWQRAVDFVQTLLIRDADTFCMKDPERALGGVRMSVSRSETRIDAVSHALRAIVLGEQAKRRLREGQLVATSGLSQIRDRVQTPED